MGLNISFFLLTTSFLCPLVLPSPLAVLLGALLSKTGLALCPVAGDELLVFFVKFFYGCHEAGMFFFSERWDHFADLLNLIFWLAEVPHKMVELFVSQRVKPFAYNIFYQSETHNKTKYRFTKIFTKNSYFFFDIF